MMLSVAYLKKQLNLPDGHTADDTYLADLEAAAVEVVEQHFGYLGAPESVTRYHIGSDAVDLILDDTPADDPAPTVTEASAVGETAEAVTDFVVRGKRLRRTGGSVWTRGYEYAVTYTRGYAPGAQPERAIHAVRMLVAHWYSYRLPVSNANATAMPHTVAELLPVNPVIA